MPDQASTAGQGTGRDDFTAPGFPQSTDFSLDLKSLERLYARGGSPIDVSDAALQRIDRYGDPAVWIARVPADAVQRQAAEAAKRRAAGEDLPLYGVPFAVKDNIDVAGCATTAACPAFAYQPKQSATCVERLLKAGALFLGKTNLDQFATGLAGDRSPHGVCRNLFDPAYIAGGSSSGSAVAVAAGLVSFALGSDTAGSGRVPAACNNIAGLKPAYGWIPPDGMVPACQSLDCVSVFALTAADAYHVAAIAAGSSSDNVQGELRETFEFAVPNERDLEFFGDGAQAKLFAEALQRLAVLGGRPHRVAYEPFKKVAALLYEGPWLAERYAALRPILATNAADLHPVTRSLLEEGKRYSAADLFEGMRELEALRPTCEKVFATADVFVVPTVPTLPRIVEVQAESRLWSKRLGQYTNFVNLLGWCALAVPAGFTKCGLPGGITLIAPAGSERRLTALGMKWQRMLGINLGATQHSLPDDGPVEKPETSKSPPAGWARVAVAGAHLQGQPLHEDLHKTGAKFVRACRTAPGYQFVALTELKPPRPGLVRDGKSAGAIAVEIYDVPFAGFGELVTSVAPPLAIGTIDLDDGTQVKGFLCESFAAAKALDITKYGGWKEYLQHRSGDS